MILKSTDSLFHELKKEITKTVVGQDKAVELLLVTLLAGGQAPSCLETLSMLDFRFKIPDSRSRKSGMRSIRHSIDRTSPAEPPQMYQKVSSS